MEPIKHSIDRKTNSANIDNHDSNDIDTTSLDDRKNETETPAPLLEILDTRDVEPDRGNGVTENFAMTSEDGAEMVGYMLNFQNIKQGLTVTEGGTNSVKGWD